MEINGDLVRLGKMIRRACQGDAAALEGVEHIAQKIKVSGATGGSQRMCVRAEAIEHLAAGILSNLPAHAPIAESALVRQLSDFIGGLERAVEQASAAPSGRAPFRRAAGASARGSAMLPTSCSDQGTCERDLGGSRGMPIEWARGYGVFSSNQPATGESWIGHKRKPP